RESPGGGGRRGLAPRGGHRQGNPTDSQGNVRQRSHRLWSRQQGARRVESLDDHSVGDRHGETTRSSRSPRGRGRWRDVPFGRQVPRFEESGRPVHLGLENRHEGPTIRGNAVRSGKSVSGRENPGGIATG